MHSNTLFAGDKRQAFDSATGKKRADNVPMLETMKQVGTWDVGKRKKKTANLMQATLCEKNLDLGGKNKNRILGGQGGGGKNLAAVLGHLTEGNKEKKNQRAKKNMIQRGGGGGTTRFKRRGKGEG